MSYSYSMTLKAYAKIILHCCKYRHLAVNGVVLGSISKETQSVQIQDTIPLFHSGIGLAPMLEIALTQVEIYSSSKGLSIVGYYHANQRLDDNSVSDTAQLIANKISQHCDKACLLLVENEKITDVKSKHALKLLVRKEQSPNWKEHTANFKLQDDKVVADTVKLVDNRLDEQLVDFDSHLDNIRLDWMNLDINKALPNSAGGIEQ